MHAADPAQPVAGPGPILVLGLGNVLMGDDGIGVAVVEAVRERWRAIAPLARADRVEFVDAGVGGLRLLNPIERAATIIAVDAAQLGLPPGQARWLDPADLRPESGAAWSLHATGLASTLQMAALLAPLPPVVVLAVQAGPIRPGQGLSAALAAAVPTLAEQLLQRLGDLVGASFGTGAAAP